MARRAKAHSHSRKNDGENCFICKVQLNRTAKTVKNGNKTVKVCRSCAEKNNLK